MDILEQRACQIIASVTCETCPLGVRGLCGKITEKISKKMNVENLTCVDTLYYWLKGVDLDLCESKKEIPLKPCWGVPCKKDDVICDSSCAYYWDSSCPYE